MVYRFIGYVRKTGEYEGRAFDNVNLSVLRPAAVGSAEVGEICEVLKVKYPDYFAANLKVGSDINVEFDRYGRVYSISSLNK